MPTTIYEGCDCCGITVDCCETPLPFSLLLTFFESDPDESSADAGCECASSASPIQFDYDDDLGYWTAASGVCTETNLRIMCVGGQLTVVSDDDCGLGDDQWAVGATNSCDPLLISVSKIKLKTGCVSGVDCTIWGRISAA